MVDNTNPTNQFHPYQPPEETKKPLAGNGFGDMLNKAGVAQDKFADSTGMISEL